MRKIAFFDIDGTLTSEIDGSIPQSAIDAIRASRQKGNLMFINTGRCFQNVEKRFQDIGFDGYICGCGTNIYCGGRDILYVPQSHEITMQILTQARKTGVDILFESRKEVAFDLSRPLQHPGALRQYRSFVNRDYQMPEDLENPNFFCDKFVIWYEEPWQLTAFRSVSDKHFACIDRGGTLREFVPHGYSKASGIQVVLTYYGIPKENAYAFGDSNNDLSMLTCLPGSIVMGNASPASLFDIASFVTAKASEDGIQKALAHLGLL
ncbi:MAG: HAD-IIB family hydrolase [Lachnospiraceae bacterium]|nr:HAD-IIB family hydrolase [Lachnospiraceae bacterium]